MKRLHFIAIVSLLMASFNANEMQAQKPKVLPDNRVEFTIKAPNATKMQVDLGKLYDMTKDENGVWKCTTEPQTEGFHYYFLSVDGTRVPDGASRPFYGCSMMASGIEIPYPNGDNRFYQQNVARGSVVQKYYYSTTAKDWRRMFVYLPPTYFESKEKLPVLYLMHGGGEDETGWVNQGRTDIILDNLIAQGKAKEMIIAMLDGNTRDFESELLNDCVPFVEKNFRVKADAEHRGLAGLSMGGIQTLNTIVPHPELFAYVGVFSSGWFATPGPFGGGDNEKMYKMMEDKKDFYNKQFKEFFFTMGGEEDIAFNNCKVMRARLDKIGIKYSYFETPGGHTWPVWRESLYQFAQKLFK